MFSCGFLKPYDLARTAAALAFLGCISGALSPVRAGTAEENYERIVAQVVVPGFGQLETAARAHSGDWKAMCDDAADGSQSAVLGSFHKLADAWAEVEMFRSSPAATDFRRDRFYLWPERKNAVGRALAAALATPADVAMDEAWIAQQSAAIQGLPVLERLLFGDDGTAGTPKAGTAECRLGVAASRNAAAIAAAMAAEWRGMDHPPTEAGRAALATDIVTGIALAKDDKLEAVVGKAGRQPKPRAAEFWRSRRSLRNLALNAGTYARIGDLIAPQFESPVMTYAARTAGEIAAGMQEPLGDYGAAGKNSEALLLAAALDSLGTAAGNEISAALGVTVGFNSSDGD